MLVTARDIDSEDRDALLFVSVNIPFLVSINKKPAFSSNFLL